MTDLEAASHRPHHIVSELGLAVRTTAAGLDGTAEVVPEMHAPGTGGLRVSVLAVWTDVLCGLLAASQMGGRVPVTLELDMHLYHPAPPSGLVAARATTVKNGRTVFAASAEFTDGDGDTFAFGSASFMAAPDPAVRLPDHFAVDMPRAARTLSVPLAERAGCRREGPGLAVLDRSEDGLNSSNTVNGGLIALAVEEAALSMSPGRSLCVLDVRYLQAVRVGPAVARAHTRAGLSRVEVRDRGARDRLAAVATARVFDF